MLPTGCDNSETLLPENSNILAGNLKRLLELESSKKMTGKLEIIFQFIAMLGARRNGQI